MRSGSSSIFNVQGSTFKVQCSTFKVPTLGPELWTWNFELGTLNLEPGTLNKTFVTRHSLGPIAGGVRLVHALVARGAPAEGACASRSDSHLLPFRALSFGALASGLGRGVRERMLVGEIVAFCDNELARCATRAGHQKSDGRNVRTITSLHLSRFPEFPSLVTHRGLQAFCPEDASRGRGREEFEQFLRRLRLCRAGKNAR